MDCGPAALKSLLDGFGIPVNYGRLREACQTDVDGTSIDTIEEIANQLGLQAEQIMLPADHVLLSEARALPAIAVVVLPNGVTHFVIVWRRFGRFVELMDPAVGRRWVSAARFLSDLYVHQQPVAAADWRTFAGSNDFLAPLRRRLHSLGIDDESALNAAINDPDWRSLAALDAALRMVTALVEAGAIDRGQESAQLLYELLKSPDQIPDHYWSVRPDGDGLLMRGAVLVRAVATSAAGAPSSPELLAALQQPSARPGRELLRLLRADGLFTPALIGIALAVSAAAVIVEAILFRGLLVAGRELIAPTIAFSCALLFLGHSAGRQPPAPRASFGNSSARRVPRKDPATGRSLFPKPPQIRYGRAQPQHSLDSPASRDWAASFCATSSRSSSPPPGSSGWIRRALPSLFSRRWLPSRSRLPPNLY